MTGLVTVSAKVYGMEEALRELARMLTKGVGGSAMGRSVVALRHRDTIPLVEVRVHAHAYESPWSTLERRSGSSDSDPERRSGVEEDACTLAPPEMRGIRSWYPTVSRKNASDDCEASAPSCAGVRVEGWGLGVGGFEC